jgi:hypothetical protein
VGRFEFSSAGTMRDSDEGFEVGSMSPVTLFKLYEDWSVNIKELEGWLVMIRQTTLMGISALNSLAVTFVSFSRGFQLTELVVTAALTGGLVRGLEADEIWRVRK